MARRRFAKAASDKSKRIQMFGMKRCRKQENENKINGTVVDCVELDRTFQAIQKAGRPAYLSEPCVGYCYAFTQSRRTKFLPTLEGGSERSRSNTQRNRRLACHLLH